MTRKLIIIYPKDVSTDFLEEIIQIVSENHSRALVLYRLSSNEEHSEIFEIVPSFSNDDLIIFLGHGTSTALSGANHGTLNYGPFISESQMKIFYEKKILLLSCRSSDFIRSFAYTSGVNSALGFPNLITDKEELEYPEDEEEIAGVTEDDILNFRKVIVRVVAKSLNDYCKDSLSFYELYNRIRFRTTLEISLLYKDSFEGSDSPLGRMIRLMRDKMLFIGN